MKQVIYTSFYNDIKKLKNKQIAQSIKDILLETATCTSIDQIKNFKKMKGHKTAYRIRINDYRIGLFVEGDTLYFSAFALRKDIYRQFP